MTTAKHSSWPLYLLIWFFAGISVYLLIETFWSQSVPIAVPRATAHALATPSIPLLACSPNTIPSNGAVIILDPAVMRRTDVDFSGLSFQNHHSTATMVTLISVDHAVAALFVNPGEKGLLIAPVGQYGLHVSWGTRWCNTALGFEDSHEVNVVGGINSRTGRTTEVVIDTALENRSGLRLTSLETPSPYRALVETGPIITAKTLELRADADGHYQVQGKVNGYPVTFLIDTGASSVTISRKFANEAGIYNCILGRRSETANGSVEVCTVTGMTVEFGQFQVLNTEVSIVPNMAADALLGMSVLRTMDMRQADGLLRLSQH